MTTLSDLLLCVSLLIAPLFQAMAVTTRYCLEVRTFNTSLVIRRINNTMLAFKSAMSAISHSGLIFIRFKNAPVCAVKDKHHRRLLRH